MQDSQQYDKQSKTVEFQFPANWWEMFKEQHITCLKVRYVTHKKLVRFRRTSVGNEFNVEG